MTFLPIVGRELRVAARRRSTYWIRALAALAAVITGGFIFATTTSLSTDATARVLLETLGWLSMPYCLFAGVYLTAACLSQEKTDGTLGLLFLTDLRGYDVVLGKLVATSVSGFFALLAIFPVLAVPLLMGGVKDVEFWRMVLALANTFLFGLSIGIFISAICKSPRWAMGWTTGLILFFSCGLPLFALMNPLMQRHGFDNLALLTCPISAFVRGFDEYYATPSMPKYFHLDYYWCSLGVVHLMTWLLLVLACIITPQSWKDRPTGALWTRWRRLYCHWNYGDPGARNAYRERLLDSNAFYWLAARARLKPLWVWAVLAAGACLWLWAWADHKSDWLDPAEYIMTAIILNTVLKVWVAVEAGYRLGEERRMGSLELLLSTPITVPAILRGQVRALLRQFFWPVLAVFGFELLCALDGFARRGQMNDSTFPGAWASAWGAGWLVMAADLWALTWIGMWVSLSARNPLTATGNALAKVLLLPWITLIVSTILWGLLILAVHASSTYDPSTTVLIGWWMAISLAIDLFFGLRSRARLYASFREVATQPRGARAWNFRRFSTRAKAAVSGNG
jgi:ABC-type transport system involved in cytochrome c biogenesis permease component